MTHDDDDLDDLRARLDARLEQRPARRQTLWRTVQHLRAHLLTQLEAGCTLSDVAEALRLEGFPHASAQNVGAALRAPDGKKSRKKSKDARSNTTKKRNSASNQSDNIKPTEENKTIVEGKILGDHPNTIRNFY